MSRLQVVVGGQFGSEAKGAVCGWLTQPQRFGDGMAVRVGGPNAGHCVVDTEGKKWPLRQTPVAAVTNPNALLGIAAGSEIDFTVLTDEILALEESGYRIRHRLFIDPAATIVEEIHQRREQDMRLVERSGSTGKGIGAARADRVLRLARTVRERAEIFQGLGIVEPVLPLIYNKMAKHQEVLIEAAQGYGLGVHTPYYPHTTSVDCSAIDALAAAGVSPWRPRIFGLRIWVVFRPFPIRIAGNSGPLEGETTWDALGLQPELTTVTRKTRRVGAWDPTLAEAAIRANGGPAPSVWVALTMADHLDPAIAGTLDLETIRQSMPVSKFLARVVEATKTPVSLIGTSDRTMVWNADD